VAYRPALLLALLITATGTLLLGFFPQYWVELSRATMFPFL
jgi:hypothetical protein